MTTKKRLGILLVCLFLVQITAPCIAFANETEQSVTQRVLSDWANFLYLQEQYLDNLSWACDHVQAFIAQPTWDELLKARAALGAMQFQQSFLKTHEQTVTAQEYLQLTIEGKDVSFVSFEIENFDLLLQDSSLCTLIYTTFTNTDISILDSLSLLEQQNIDNTAYYYALSTNYLCNEIATAEERQNMQAIMADFCPLIASTLTQWSTDNTWLEQEASVVFDTIENNLLQHSETIGMAQYQLNLLNDAIETGDFTEWQKDLFVLEGVDHTVLMPPWTIDGTLSCVYFWTEGENRTYILAQDDLAHAPNGYWLTWENISKETFELYPQKLQAWGMEPLLYADDEEHCTLQYALNDITFALQWKENTATFYCLEEPIYCSPN